MATAINKVVKELAVAGVSDWFIILLSVAQIQNEASR
jgi:hypothetical protein